MGFLIRVTSSQSVVHQNNLSALDFNQDGLNESQWVDLNFPFGDMKMKQWMFDGIRMAHTEWVLRKPMSFDWEGNYEVITMYYSLKGGVSIGSNAENKFELGNNEQNMFYGSDASGYMKLDELKMKSFMLQFSKASFLRIAEGGTDALKAFADNVANNKSTSFSPKGLPVDAETEHAILAVTNCRFNNSLKKVFLLSKAMELLVLQADAYARISDRKVSNIRTEYDRDRIHFAREHMLKNIDKPPSIPELAKITGMNEFKLKKGYKELFGTTIFAHLADSRLQLAKSQLLETNRSISEIAFDLGYSSAQHFSLAFKKKFGLSPGKIKTRQS